MNADRKTSAVTCMQRMFRAQKAAGVQPSVGVIANFSNVISRWGKLPPKGDRASVREWIIRDWANARMRYKSAAANPVNEDTMEQVSSVFEEISTSVNTLQASCLANSATFQACQQQLQKSDESLQRISAMIDTLEKMVQAPQSPEKNTE